MSQTREQKRFTISEVPDDLRELMVSWRIMRPSIACTSKQLAPKEQLADMTPVTIA